MTDEINILVVDDEPMNRTIMVELLGGEFNVQCAEDSLCCIDMLEAWQPDLILMDVKMPGINGLDTCKQIKMKPEMESIPIIFVSALGSPEEKMAGYEAGGDDYIVKPYMSKELIKKIHLSIANSKKLKESQKNFKDSFATAMTAMTSAAELGEVLHFYQNSFGLNADEEVVSSLFSILSSYGLNAVIGVFKEQGTKYESHTGVVRSIEISVIEQIRKRKGSIFNFGCRSTYSYSNITILILDMPVEDDERYGRLKDLIAMLAEGGNARLVALISENEKKKHEKNLQNLLTATSVALQDFKSQQNENVGEIENIMSTLVSDVEGAFISLGLTDEQEQSLLGVIQQSEKNAKTLFDKDQALHEDLAEILSSLSVHS